MSTEDEKFMNIALSQAQAAALLDEVPVGAIIVDEKGEIVSEAYNIRETAHDPVGHAEIIAIHHASQKLERWRLSGCTLYVTLEPCLMCSGAIVLSRLDRVVYGAVDPKAGAVESLYKTLSDTRLNHRPQVTSGVLQNECSLILKEFFTKKRLKPKSP